MREQTLAVQRMQDYIEQNKTMEITLSDLAKVSLFSPWYSYRLFREYLGLTPTLKRCAGNTVRARTRSSRDSRRSTALSTKSTKTILRHPEKYHVQQAIKLGDYNVGRNGPILTLPLYMAFLLRSI